jgi:diphthine synthase
MGKLTFVGLGLYNHRDISVKGLEAARAAEEVYAEFYTSYLAGTTLEELERVLGKKIKVLTREEVEGEDENILLNAARGKNIVFLTAGDPMTATTHVDLRLRAFDRGIEVSIIHGSSIATAVPGLLGLQHYKFGRTTTIPFPYSYDAAGEEEGYIPESPYEVIRDNKRRGLHTLVLLDIVGADEHRKGKPEYMTANEGIELLLTIEARRRENVFLPETLVCVVARASSEHPLLRAAPAKELLEVDFGPPMHTIVVPATLHFKEAEALVKFADAPRKLLLE